jgi:putative redox protein
MDLITITRRENLEFKIQVRGQDLTSDMSLEDGGRGAGFSPAELLAGSLGACIAMMVQGYCDRNGYTDGDVAVSLTIELADKPKRVGAIVIDVELPDGVPEDRWEAIRRVAEKCTIHETFNHPPRVDVEFM